MNGQLPLRNNSHLLWPDTLLRWSRKIPLERKPSVQEWYILENNIQKDSSLKSDLNVVLAESCRKQGLIVRKCSLQMENWISFLLYLKCLQYFQVDFVTVFLNLLLGEGKTVYIQIWDGFVYWIQKLPENHGI